MEDFGDTREGVEMGGGAIVGQPSLSGRHLGRGGAEKEHRGRDASIYVGSQKTQVGKNEKGKYTYGKEQVPAKTSQGPGAKKIGVF